MKESVLEHTVPQFDNAFFQKYVSISFFLCYDFLDPFRFPPIAFFSAKHNWFEPGMDLFFIRSSSLFYNLPLSNYALNTGFIL